MPDAPNNADTVRLELGQKARQLDVQATNDSARCDTGLDSNQRWRSNSDPSLPVHLFVQESECTHRHTKCCIVVSRGLCLWGVFWSTVVVVLEPGIGAICIAVGDITRSR